MSKIYYGCYLVVVEADTYLVDYIVGFVEYERDEDAVATSRYIITTAICLPSSLLSLLPSLPPSASLTTSPCLLLLPLPSSLPPYLPTSLSPTPFLPPLPLSLSPSLSSLIDTCFHASRGCM